MSAAEKRIITRQEVLDYLEKLPQGLNDRPTAIGVLDMAVDFIGFDPSQGQRPHSLGGPSFETCINKHLSLTALRKLLKAMVEERVVAEVSGDNRAVVTASHLASRKFFLLGARYRVTSARHEAALRDENRRKVWAKAEKAVLDRHREEVQNTYEFMCRSTGVDPEYEVAQGA